MSTSQPARLPEQEDESSTRKEENLSTENQPRTHRRERRFELGFFVRKVVNGWVVFYKQFPPGERAVVHARETGHAFQEKQADASSERPMLAMANAGSEDVAGGGVTTTSGTGKGSGDAGPIGETRFEVGFYATSSTTTGDGEGDDS